MTINNEREELHRTIWCFSHELIGKSYSITMDSFYCATDRMSKNAYINLESIEKTCLSMGCRIEDVIEIIKDEEKNDDNNR